VLQSEVLGAVIGIPRNQLDNRFLCMLQCVAVCCSVWQCVAVCCSVNQRVRLSSYLQISFPQKMAERKKMLARDPVR